MRFSSKKLYFGRNLFKFGFIPLVLVICFLTGCNSVPVAQDLNQHQATQIVAALNEKGISAVAARESGSKPKYSVTIRESNYSQAVSILAANLARLS